jgi:riboflavin kinase/FMN adenylyltransferase
LDRDDLELYDEEVVLEFVARIRPTLRFERVTALVDQMRQDVVEVAAALGVGRGTATLV